MHPYSYAGKSGVISLAAAAALARREIDIVLLHHASQSEFGVQVLLFACGINLSCCMFTADVPSTDQEYSSRHLSSDWQSGVHLYCGVAQLPGQPQQVLDHLACRPSGCSHLLGLRCRQHRA